MGIFVNSWPVGIAAALLLLPMIAEPFGIPAALWSVAGLIAVGLLLFAIMYQPPGQSAAKTVAGSPRLRGPALNCVLIAAGIWGSTMQVSV